ncbi:2485_t:CDS:2, partial [Cetraspora pellucida]
MRLHQFRRSCELDVCEQIKSRKSLESRSPKDFRDSRDPRENHLRYRLGDLTKYTTLWSIDQATFQTVDPEKITFAKFCTESDLTK